MGKTDTSYNNGVVGYTFTNKVYGNGIGPSGQCGDYLLRSSVL